MCRRSWVAAVGWVCGVTGCLVPDSTSTGYLSSHTSRLDQKQFKNGSGACDKNAHLKNDATGVPRAPGFNVVLGASTRGLLLVRKNAHLRLKCRRRAHPNIERGGPGVPACLKSLSAMGVFIARTGLKNQGFIGLYNEFDPSFLNDCACLVCTPHKLHPSRRQRGVLSLILVQCGSLG